MSSLPLPYGIRVRARARARAVGLVPIRRPFLEFASRNCVPKLNRDVARGLVPKLCPYVSPSVPILVPSLSQFPRLVCPHETSLSRFPRLVCPHDTSLSIFVKVFVPNLFIFPARCMLAVKSSRHILSCKSLTPTCLCLSPCRGVYMKITAVAEQQHTLSLAVEKVTVFWWLTKPK